MTSPPPDAPTQLLGIRLAPAVIARLDAVAAALTRPGLEATRTDALRVALMTGLHALETELRPPPPCAAPAAKKRRAPPRPPRA